MDAPKPNEELLTDFLLGRCDPQEAFQIRQKLGQDPSFRRLHDDLRNTFSAIRLLPEIEPPDDLADRTLAMIRASRRTEALLAQEEVGRRVYRPTFSLRELAAVASVLVLLAFVFIPSVREARRQANVRACASQVGQVGAAMLTYASANGGRLPAITASTRRWLPNGTQPFASNSASLFKLVSGNYASPVWFQCPAAGGGSFVVTREMNDFPASRFVSYSYLYSIDRSISENDPAIQPYASRMAILADNSPLTSATRLDPADAAKLASENHGKRGQNVLYLSGNVSWSTSPLAGVDDNNIYLPHGVYTYTGEEAPTGPTDSFLLHGPAGR